MIAQRAETGCRKVVQSAKTKRALNEGSLKIAVFYQIEG
jgi:hypothetical protein